MGSDDLDTWADAYIRSPKMTARLWDAARRAADTTTAYYRDRTLRARALLAARDRVIAGLTAAQRFCLQQGIDLPLMHRSRCDWRSVRGLERKGLAEVGSGNFAKLTPLGHECAAELQRREGVGRGD